ncbi:alpha/beta hydrolase [Streptomyces beijiangensis]|uniref:Alpha/beta hydrolase n=1 Tax=Streptomyces beijiangensis TaxID=163361 RepID=A0A939FEA4_9ACTN|nr:alpha/beta hydrolase [Streptomyces beijiangensis]MBO0516596.1 alpha/beta hydrolase [Streptomyces beijiangensis]
MTNTANTTNTTAGSRTKRGAVAACAAVALALGAAAPALALTGTDTSTGVHHIVRASRGTLVSVVPVADHTRAEVAAFVKDAGADPSVVRYGVTAYRLTYRTVTAEGRPTTATGLLVLPKNGVHRLPVVSDTHGTMSHRDYAPSVAEDMGRLSPYVQAAAGRAVSAPDYLGLGKGPGLHPYMDTRSGVSATLDMLRASRTAARQLGRPFTGDVYVTGFSQGGQVAMALGKALSEGADRSFRLKAVAPIAGPYDLEGVEIQSMFNGSINDTSAVFYMSYFLTAQNRLHPLWKEPADVFRAPYDKVVTGLFDGLHADEDIVKALPPTLKGLFTDAYLKELQHPTGVLKSILKANDGTCDWKPAVPVQLYSASGDTDVPIANARSCAAQLAAHGVKAPVVDQGAVDHGGSAIKSVAQIARWFDRVEQRG